MSNFVYVMSNPAFPSILKIGRSADPENRRSQLSSQSCLPYPFFVEFQMLHSEAIHVEYETHEMLKNCRISKNREFFRICVEEAKSSIEKAAVIVSTSSSLTSGQAAIKKAIELCGGTQAKLVSLTNGRITQATISKYLRGVQEISPLSALIIESVTNGKVTRLDILPDIFDAAMLPVDTAALKKLRVKKAAA